MARRKKFRLSGKMIKRGRHSNERIYLGRRGGKMIIIGNKITYLSQFKKKRKR